MSSGIISDAIGRVDLGRSVRERVRGSALAGRLRSDLQTDEVASWPVDLGLVVAASMAIVTEAAVLWFHLIFVLLVFTALIFPFRRFAIRLVLWSAVSTGLVTWAVARHDTPSEELSELPILTFVLIVVFLVAQSRARSHAAYAASRVENDGRAERELQTLREQLEQSQRLDVLGRSSTRLAHEMRNLMTIVRGCASELADDHDPRVRDHADEVLEAVDRGIAMLDELVVVGRANRLRTELLDLRSLLAHSEPLLSHFVPDGIELRMSLPTGPVEVTFDRTSFMQIVMNLVSNSVDAIDRTGFVEVGVRRVNRHRGGSGGLEPCAVIEVTDTGKGMPAHGPQDVFVPGNTTKSGPHSGLGLPTVWQIAARNAGTVEIDSSPGTGTTVSVFLPIATSSTAAPRKCAIVVADASLRAKLVAGFAEFGFEHHDWVEGEHVEVDLLVHDSTTVLSPTLRANRTIVLGGAGGLPVPTTPVDCAVLVRRVVVSASTSTSPATSTEPSTATPVEPRPLCA